MFTYADLNKIGYDHFLFNTGYFSVLKNIYPNEKVEFYCEKTHFEYIKAHIDNHKLEYKPVYVLPPKKTSILYLFFWLYKNLQDISILYKILKSSSKQSGKLIFFATMPVRSMLYLVFMHKFLFPNTKILLTLHGEIESMFVRNKNLTQNIHTYIFRKIIFYKNDNFRIFLPNDYIKSNIQKSLKIIDNKLLSVWNFLRHTNKQKSINNKIILGHIGATAKRKNSSQFFQLANRLFEFNPNLKSKVLFFVAGKYSKEFNYVFKPENVELADQIKILSLKHFDSNIESLDYSVIFFKDDEYIYRESATVLESLKFYKPIIGISHPYFEFLESQYGKIGIFEPTEEKLIQRLSETFNDKNNLEYTEFIKNISNLHERNSLEKLSEKLLKQLKDLDTNYSS